MSIAKDRILYEDEHLLAVSKRVGELVVRGSGKVSKLPLVDFLKQQYPGLKVLHRLDFETSGVVLFAKNAEVSEQIISSDFSSWEKQYLTLVMGVVDRNSGVIKQKLPARSDSGGARKGAAARKSSLVDAQTHYKVLERFANSTYVSCQILTGRHHQIRRHFAGIDHPLVLDREYGHGKFNQLFRQELGFSKFFLHASSLKLKHPVTGEQLEIEAPMPAPFTKCLKTLRDLSGR